MLASASGVLWRSHLAIWGDKTFAKKWYQKWIRETRDSEICMKMTSTSKTVTIVLSQISLLVICTEWLLKVAAASIFVCNIWKGKWNMGYHGRWDTAFCVVFIWTISAHVNKISPLYSQEADTDYGPAACGWFTIKLIYWFGYFLISFNCSLRLRQ